MRKQKSVEQATDEKRGKGNKAMNVERCGGRRNDDEEMPIMEGGTVQPFKGHVENKNKGAGARVQERKWPGTEPKWRVCKALTFAVVEAHLHDETHVLNLCFAPGRHLKLFG